MADENIIIEGNVKFRDGKKWKSRWCVMRRLSPVADCVQVQVWRDWRARAAAAPGGCKAALSLEKFLGCEAGFTLDKHSHTLALVCRDLVAVLAFDTRERLMQWQVKVCNQLGEPRQYLVLVGGGGGRRLPAGPARLHLHEARFALTAGVPPRLLGVWELQHLRRYGVVEGRFCFEGGSLCGKGEGLHVLVSDQARDIARDFELASQGRLSPKRRPYADRRNNGAESPRSHKAYRPDTRLSELSAEGAGGAGGAEEAWPATEMGLGDAASLGEPANSEGPWAGAGASLERCVSCMSKLGALSRSSTAALTPGAKHFNPAWTMEAVQESSERACECPPERPPRPITLTLGRKPRPAEDARSTGVGPYENYDVPRVPSSEAGEYYDTPKRLKECVDSELFRMSRGGAGDGGGVVLAKPCGCLLRLARRPAVVADDGPAPPPACPCRRVTDWANSWIRFPYCKRNVTNGDSIALDKENMVPTVDEHSALYAKIDLSRKVNRKLGAASDRSCPITAPESRTDPKSIQIDNGPLANYENLSFALSLEHYENAKDLLRSAGVTQAELNAISANLKPSSFTSVSEDRSCNKYGHHRPRDREADSSNDDYLMMEPAPIDLSKGSAPPAGYTPMSPIGGFAFYTLRQRVRSPVGGLPAEKSASNPALCDGSGERATAAAGPPLEPRQRSSSADSSRFLDEREETNEARGSASSLETLRGAGEAAPGCRCRGGKHSDGDSSEASRARRSAGAAAAGTRDSSSSNDSGVSSWSRRAGACYETPRTTAQARRHYRTARRPPPPARPPRRARSLGETHSPSPSSPDPAQPPPQNKSSSAEAEVPLLSMRLLRGGTISGLADAHSTSSGASDMSDYIETLSLCSSHSSTDTPVTMRVSRQMTSTLRPRSGKEYLNLDARLATMRRPPQPPAAVHGAHASHAGHAAHASHAAHAGLGIQPPRLPQRQPYTNLP